MKQLTIFSYFIASITLGLLVATTISNAQTPDGETPATEGVCDPLVGGTPGLYGLCVAYCEAQDSDTLEPGNPPSSRLLDIYNKRKGSADPEMPCRQEPCPCWSEEDLDVALTTITACEDLYGDADPFVDGVSIFGPSPSSSNNARLLVFNVFSNAQCFFIVQEGGLPNSGVRREMIVTGEEGAICEASIRQHAESLGVACEIAE